MQDKTPQHTPGQDSAWRALWQWLLAEAPAEPEERGAGDD